MAQKRVLIIAGPNGAGKTTLARELLPRELRRPIFINADLIAAGLYPFSPERGAMAAARLMLTMMAEMVERGESFAFETTLAGRGYVRQIEDWRTRGYHVTLLYLSLPSPEVALARVAERVLQGGHAVPEAVVRRRFAAGRRNFEQLYRDLVDDWVLYDNSGPTPVRVAWKERS